MPGKREVVVGFSLKQNQKDRRLRLPQASTVTHLVLTLNREHASSASLEVLN